MGYTHYWTPETTIDAAVWEKITKATIGVLSMAKDMGVTIVGGHGDEGTKPEITDKFIVLNGIPCHESLYLEPNHTGFAFCKTAFKEYDVVVTAVLCLVEHLTGNAFQVSSDGTPEEWAEGLALANDVLSGVKLPPGVTA